MESMLAWVRNEESTIQTRGTSVQSRNRPTKT